MKAALIEHFGSLVVREIPDPQPGPYDALCALRYGATCTGTDSHIIDGSFPWISPLPTVLGHESVGRVIAVGAKVRHLRVGDLITRVGDTGTPDGAISVTWGGFAEYGIAKDHWAMCADGLPAEEWQGARWNQVVPHGVAEEIAPMFTTWRETLSYLLRTGGDGGEHRAGGRLRRQRPVLREDGRQPGRRRWWPWPAPPTWKARPRRKAA